METIFMNTGKRKIFLTFHKDQTYEALINTCCSSILIYLLHMEKNKTTAEKQETQNNNCDMK